MNTLSEWILPAVFLLPAAFFLLSARTTHRRRTGGILDRSLMERVAAHVAAAFAPTLAEMASEGPPDEGVLRIKLEEVVEDAITEYARTARPHPDDMPGLDPWDRRLVNETDDSRPSYAPADEPIPLVRADRPKP